MRRARSTPAEFCAFYASTLAGRSPAAWRRCASASSRDVDRAAHRRGGARAGRAHTARRRSARADDRDQPLPDRADRRATSASTTWSRPSSSSRPACSPGATRRAEHARGQGRRGSQRWLAAQGWPPRHSATATFYSDSTNDLPLLRAVGHPVAVDPGPAARGSRPAAQAGRCCSSRADRGRRRPSARSVAGDDLADRDRAAARASARHRVVGAFDARTAAIAQRHGVARVVA